MSNALLFGSCCLIWGSTWIAITYQVSNAPEIVAVAWRFTVATLFEGDTWSVLSATGVIIILLGNAVAMGKVRWLNVRVAAPEAAEAHSPRD